MTKSYLLVGEEQQGPYSDEEIRTMLAAGRITAKTPCWKEGMPDWQPLGSIEGELTETVSTIAPPRRSQKSGARRDQTPTITKETVHANYDLSPQAKPMTLVKGVILLVLFLVLIFAMIQVIGRLTPDPVQGLANQVWQIEHR